MTKKERICIVVSAVWLIVVLWVAIDMSLRYSIKAEVGLEATTFHLARFVQAFAAGNLPLVIGWGYWWIRRG